MSEKWCPRHKAFHPMDAFAPAKHTKDKLQGWCRQAFAEYGRAYREQRKARADRLAQSELEAGQS